MKSPMQDASSCATCNPESKDNMPPEIDRTVSASDLELMERYGIKRTPADYYNYGQYRYTNLKDAVAQAERDKYKSA